MHKHRRARNHNKSYYEDYFRKKYTFSAHSEYRLPETIFESQRWIIPQLQDMKKELNDVKGLLNKYDLKTWSKHTAFRDPSGSIIKKISETIQPELLTQAWCKFYEILKKFPVLPADAILNKKVESLHLCEAPGAFVSAFNHFLVTEYPEIQFNWLATTLNPNYEGNQLTQMIADDRLIRHSLENWNFGADFTGDLTKYNNHCAITNSDFCQRKISVVTADGSIDCMKDPGEQEKFVEYLHFCETITALSVLKPGGTYILKIFTMFEDSTINLLYLLNCLFENVAVFKPCTSKSGNSEVYVINSNYKGLNLLDGLWEKLLFAYKHGTSFFLAKSMFNLFEIPTQFFEEIRFCANFFMANQIRTILDNIYHFENKPPDNVQSKKWSVTKLFFQYIPINIMPEEKKLVPGVPLGKNWRVHPENIDTTVRQISCDNFIHKLSLFIHIEIKIGKRIEHIHNSKFAPKDCLPLLQSDLGLNRNNSQLYLRIFQTLFKDNVILDAKDFDLTVYYKFQLNLFFKIANSISGKNLIFINIPLLTHFLVGLLYILLYGYKKVVFWNGCVILYDADIRALQEVKHVFNEIDSLYRKIFDHQSEQRCDFERDIIQLVSPTKFDEGLQTLVDLVWNYNSQVFARRESSVSLSKSLKKTDC